MSAPSGAPARTPLAGERRALLESVAAAPLAPRRLAIEAPGGYGKTRLLQELGEVYRRAGVRVVEVWHELAAGATEPDPGEDGARTVLLADDAQLLDEDRMGRLHRLVADGRAGLVVAYRPWPRPAPLTDLLGATGRPLRLSPLTEQQTAACLGEDPEPALVSFVHHHTGGVPRLVERLAAALSWPAVAPPPAALAPFRAELVELPAEVRTVLLAAAAGLDVTGELVGELLGRRPEELGQLVAAAHTTGLLGADGRLLPLARRAVATLSPAAHRSAVWRRLAQLQRARGAAVLPLARSLRAAGAESTGLGELFEAAAEEALPDEPALAAELFETAAAGRTDRTTQSTTARRALAATLAGDLDLGLRLADSLIGAADPGDRAAGAAVAAAALAHRGQLARSADLSHWAGTAASVGFATVGFLGTGQPERSSESPPVAPPTLLTSAAGLLAQGTQESVTGCPTAALATLVRAASLLEPAGQAVLLPDTPAALAALVAVHTGELDLGASVLDRALSVTMGEQLMVRRHQLLQAWIRMLRGHTLAAVQLRTAATAPQARLELRDQLFATALDAGIARRNSDLAELRRSWRAAHEVVMRHPVDLFTLLPVGELAVAAARLGELPRFLPHLQEGYQLLGRLSNPPLWSAMLRWYHVHAAILAEQPAVAEEQLAALADLAPRLQFAQVLVAAARTWVEVLGGAVDADTVEAAARRLHAAGLTWDAARLAGQAAIRTPDRRAMTRLLDCARTLQGRSTAASPGAAAESWPEAADSSLAEQLSAREHEVAALLLEGLTYRQIGDRLYISAKTVEHHVARMRQRLGCASRRDLLAQLRGLDRRPAWPRRPTRRH